MTVIKERFAQVKKKRNSVHILLSIFLQNFPSIFTHFSLFYGQKQCGNSTEKGQRNFRRISALSFTWTMNNFFRVFS